MKRLVLTLSLLFVAVPAMVCCSYNDDDEPKDDRTAIQYRITVDEPIIAAVKYRQADGTMVAETNPTHTTQQWFTTEYVEPPFEAEKHVHLVNGGNIHVPYTLSIYVNGDLIKTHEGTVPPQTEEMAMIDHDVVE